MNGLWYDVCHRFDSDDLMLILHRGGDSVNLVMMAHNIGDSDTYKKQSLADTTTTT